MFHKLQYLEMFSTVRARFTGVSVSSRAAHALSLEHSDTCLVSSDTGKNLERSVHLSFDSSFSKPDSVTGGKMGGNYTKRVGT